VLRAIWNRDKLGDELWAAMREVAGFLSHHPLRPSITGRVRNMIFRSSKAD
jgi:hypothetical protein